MTASRDAHLLGSLACSTYYLYESCCIFYIYICYRYHDMDVSYRRFQTLMIRRGRKRISALFIQTYCGAGVHKKKKREYIRRHSDNRTAAMVLLVGSDSKRQRPLETQLICCNLTRLPRYRRIASAVRSKDAQRPPQIIRGRKLT